MQTAVQLKERLAQLDRKSYGAYKELKGCYQFQGYQLSIDHVQGDPFASPSKVSVLVKGSAAGFRKEDYEVKHRRIALQDHLTRIFGRVLEEFSFQAKGSGKSGLIGISKCGQEILERTACQIHPETGDLRFRLEIGFPANGRSINARELQKILSDYLPQCVKRAGFYQNVDAKKVKEVMDLADDQQEIRSQLALQGLVAFVANGSILPRASGVSDRPMKDAIPFVSPKEMEVTLTLPHRGTLTGMGIRKGITLIVGGGYHGKSTLLQALERGVYPHIKGDGREYVVTDASAMKLRAEDGRSIKKTDISMFIGELPNGKDTRAFYTEDASGSTSQAANVVEAVEAGTKVLLIDEDTSATNFMVRDELMQRVIHRDMEPITPFIERMRELYERFDVSTVIVAGSCGAYFQVADQIVHMDRYVPKEITAYAKEQAQAFPLLSGPKPVETLPIFERIPAANRQVRAVERLKLKTGREGIQLQKEWIDLRYVEQLVDAEQVAALGYCMAYLEKHVFDQKKTVQEVVCEMINILEKKGLEAICEQGSKVAALAMPRQQELFACINRYRGLQL